MATCSIATAADAQRPLRRAANAAGDLRRRRQVSHHFEIRPRHNTGTVGQQQSVARRASQDRLEHVARLGPGEVRAARRQVRAAQVEHNPLRIVRIGANVGERGDRLSHQRKELFRRAHPVGEWCGGSSRPNAGRSGRTRGRQARSPTASRAPTATAACLHRAARRRSSSAVNGLDAAEQPVTQRPGRHSVFSRHTMPIDVLTRSCK